MAILKARVGGTQGRSRVQVGGEYAKMLSESKQHFLGLGPYFPSSGKLKKLILYYKKIHT